MNTVLLSRMTDEQMLTVLLHVCIVEPVMFRISALGHCLLLFVMLVDGVDRVTLNQLLSSVICSNDD